MKTRHTAIRLRRRCMTGESLTLDVTYSYTLRDLAFQGLRLKKPGERTLSAFRSARKRTFDENPEVLLCRPKPLSVIFRIAASARYGTDTENSDGPMASRSTVRTGTGMERSLLTSRLCSSFCRCVPTERIRTPSAWTFLRRSHMRRLLREMRIPV